MSKSGVFSSKFDKSILILFIFWLYVNQDDGD